MVVRGIELAIRSVFVLSIALAVCPQGSFADPAKPSYALESFVRYNAVATQLAAVNDEGRVVARDTARASQVGVRFEAGRAIRSTTVLPVSINQAGLMIGEGRRTGIGVFGYQLSDMAPLYESGEREGEVTASALNDASQVAGVSPGGTICPEDPERPHISQIFVRDLNTDGIECIKLPRSTLRVTVRDIANDGTLVGHVLFRSKAKSAMVPFFKLPGQEFRLVDLPGTAGFMSATKIAENGDILITSLSDTSLAYVVNTSTPHRLLRIPHFAAGTPREQNFYPSDMGGIDARLVVGKLSDGSAVVWDRLKSRFYSIRQLLNSSEARGLRIQDAAPVISSSGVIAVIVRANGRLGVATLQPR